MKRKFLYLLIICLVLISGYGCSLFEFIDSSDENDTKLDSYIYEQKLDDGGEENYRELDNIIEERIQANEELKTLDDSLNTYITALYNNIDIKNPILQMQDDDLDKIEEYIRLKTYQAEAELGLAGITALNTIEVLFNLNDNTLEERNSAKITDLAYNVTNIEALQKSAENYLKTLPATTTINSEYYLPIDNMRLKDDYLGGGLSAVTFASYLLLNVFGEEIDGRLEYYPILEFSASQYIVNEKWSNDKKKIIAMLRYAVNSIVYGLSVDEFTDNEEDKKVIVENLNNFIGYLDLEIFDTISQTDYELLTDYIFSMVFLDLGDLLPEGLLN